MPPFGLDFFRHPAAGLTSFITERSKQERCHRFDAVDADQGAEPPGPRTAENYQMPLPPASTRPTLRAGGSGLSAKEKMKSIGPAACKEKASVYRSCCRTFHPACKVRPGAAGGGMADRSSWAGVQRISSSGRRPPVRKGGDFFGSFLVAQKGTYTDECLPKNFSLSKRWRLSWFFFRRRKKNSPPAVRRKIREPVFPPGLSGPQWTAR